jgi:hypothetical protein
MNTILLIILSIGMIGFVGIQYSDAFFEDGIVIEVPGQIMNMSQNVISSGETMFVDGSFKQPVDDFTANIFKDYEYSSKLVLTLSPSSNEFGDFNFNFTIPQDWELGNYHIVLENGLQFMDWEFDVRKNYSVVTLDRTVYPVPWDLSPLKQFKSGISLDDIQCKNNLVLIQKHDGSPVCVTSETKQKLIERGWTNYDDIGNMLSSKYVGISDVEKLLVKNKIDYLPDKLIIAGGLSIMGDSGCGAVIDIDSQTHWFVIDSISDPKKITFLQETPQMCKVNTSSCYCHVHKELTALTLNELSYFTSAEQEKYSEILIEYLYDQNINRTPKFQIGKLNLNYTDAAAIGYCGHIWGTNTYGFFSGAVVNDVVEDYRIDKELPLLCAISDDAKWWENEN